MLLDGSTQYYSEKGEKIPCMLAIFQLHYYMTCKDSEDLTDMEIGLGTEGWEAENLQITPVQT